MAMLLWNEVRQSAAAASGWHSTEGKIVVSQVRKETAYVGRGNRAAAFYRPAITYAYRVEGRDYQAERIRFGGDAGGSEPSAKAAVERYPEDGKVMVWYDPANPSRAVLEMGVAPAAWLFAAMTLVLLVLGAKASGLIGR
jgi:hypothetical protein